LKKLEHENENSRPDGGEMTSGTRELELLTPRLGSNRVSALRTCGYQFAHELMDVEPGQLAYELDLSDEETAQEIKKSVSGVGRAQVEGRDRNWLRGEKDGAASVWEMLHYRKEKGPRFFVSEIDRLTCPNLGGLPLGTITEIVGVPGSGKTQLAMQLCVTAAQPKQMKHGCEGEALYIDTEGSLFPSRLREIAQSLLGIFNDYLSPRKLPTITLEKVLGGIHVVRTTDPKEFRATLEALPGWLDAHPKVKVVVVDSIVAPIRASESRERKLLRTRAPEILAGVAMARRVAVVIINQMTTKIKPKKQLVPAMGDLFGHVASIRIQLQIGRGGARLATILKSVGMPAGANQTCKFAITSDRVESVN